MNSLNGQVGMLTLERRGQLPEQLQLDLKKKTLSDLLEEAAARFPDKIAISTPHASISFKELNESAARIAKHLISKHIEPQSRIAVFADPGPEIVIAMLAIWKAGAVFVPIDPLLQKQKISDILEQTKPAALLSAADPIPSYLQDEVPSFSIRELLETPPGDVPLENLSSPKDAAYIVFTAEAADTLKGIELRHAGAVNLVYWYRTRHDFGEKDTAALLARPCSDLSLGQVLTALLNGAAIKIPPHDALHEAKSLIEWIEKEGVSLIFLTVPLTEALLRQPWPKETPLRILFTGGSQLKKLPKDSLPFTLINNYGPPENTVISTEHLVTPEEESLVIPIGQPIANVKTHVLDERMQEVPHGGTGQLCLGGIGLAGGYINDDELNHKRFIVHTRLGRRPETLFLTGDLVRKRKDGKLEYLGKIDQQKLLGDSQVGISAIESILNSHPGVHQAVVKLADVSDEKILVAYWVGDGGSGASHKELKRTLKKRLPACMIPKRFIQMTQIPIGPDGKVCYKELPIPQIEDPHSDEDDLPQNTIEKQLMALWREELGIGAFGTHKTLFDVQAASSTVQRLLSRINHHFGKDYNLLDLLHNDSVAALAELIMTPASRLTQDGWLKAPAGGSGIPLFCVHGLEGDLFPYYLLSKILKTDTPIYCLPAAEDDDSIEKMAKDYADNICKVYPEGGICLLGFSIGSYIAFEMGKIFKEKKRPVSFVGIIDTYAPHCPHKHPLLKRLQINTSRFLGLTYQEKKNLIIERWQHLEQKTSHLLGMSPEEKDALIPQSLIQTFQKAMGAYSPEPCDIPLTVIIPQETDYLFDDPSKGWKDYTSDLTIEKIPTNSQNLFETQNIRHLAQILIKRIHDTTSHP